MTDIILARHGETEWNVEEVFRGRADIDLNETGMRQARLLARFLSETKIEAIYSSPLKRALKTAGAIAQNQNIAVEVVTGLIDQDFGEWQGLPAKEVRDKYGELYREWLTHPEKVNIPGAESLDSVRKRAMAVVEDAVTKHQGAVILVSHRVVNKVLTCALLGLDNSHFWSIRQDTCGVTTFSYQTGRYVLVEHNNTSFLKPLQKARLSDF